MTMLRNVTVYLGARDMVINGRVIGTVASIVVQVEEATEEELAALKETPVILLLKPLPERIYKEAK